MYYLTLMKNKLLLLSIFVVASAAFFVTSTNTASAAVVYNSIDAPLPGSYPSMGYEATSTKQLGDHISFSGTERELSAVTVTLTNWACENDYTWTDGSWVANRASADPCITTPGSFFSHPITLNIYSVDHSGANPAPGALLKTKTIDAKIYYRPSYDPQSNCTVPGSDIPFGGTWYSAGDNKCLHGFNQNVSFDFTGDSITLPEEVIFSVAYNTADYGASPLHAPGPYNSLNYGLSTTTHIGTDVEPSTIFMDSSWAGGYCDSGLAGSNFFRRDADCWAGYVPAAKFEAVAPVSYITVHILKYLDGQKATTVPGGYQFPMSATWNAANIGSGTGNYVLGNSHGGTPDLYGANTSPMSAPADYTTSEITNGTSQVVASSVECAPGKYLLNGYRTSSVDFATAATATLTPTAPVFNDLTSDQYIIVDNSSCPTTGSIGGMKYNDLNRNGKKDASEPGLSGWVIRLKQGSVTTTTVTDANGMYSFTNLLPGTYKVRETHQNGWKRMSKNPKPIVLIAGAAVVDVNFGNAQKRKNEREDDNRDDDRDDESGNYYTGHHDNDYDKDSRSHDHSREQGLGRR